jgi:cysteine desulfuration protein SufE
MELPEILRNFSEMTSDDERFRYLYELGLMLGPMPKEVYEPQNRVHGCTSQVWLETLIDKDKSGPPVLIYRGDSDAHIVRGLLAILLELFSGRTATEIIQIDPSPVFEAIGFEDLINSQRGNGLRALISRIKNDARDALRL